MSRQSPLEMAASVAWIESHQSLRDHPKALKLTRRLGCSRAEVIGYLHMLWWWALDYAQDGNLGTFDSEEIAIAADYPGDPDFLVASLKATGFLDADGAIHDWDQYGMKYLVRREQARLRQQRYRDEQGCYSRDGNAEVTRDMSVSHTVTGQDREERRGEDREERQEQPAPAPAAREKEPYTAEFETFWKAYGPTDGPKRPAFVAWKRLGASDRAAALAALPNWHTSRKWREGFKVYPQKYLSQRFWETVPDSGPARASPNGRGSNDPNAMFDLAKRYAEQGQ